MPTNPIVCIVDDDESVRESVSGLLRSFGIESQAYASAEAFLAGYDTTRPLCVLLDITMPGLSGPELQEQLLAEGRNVPIVFITARMEGGLRARLLARGATACLVKPFQGEELLRAVRTALGQDREEPA